MKILQAIGGTIILLGMYSLMGTLEYNSQIELEKLRLENARDNDIHGGANAADNECAVVFSSRSYVV
jgi:hypothetical protein